jgi:hypothetical protein
MNDLYEYCPKCDGIRSASVSVSLLRVPGRRGKSEEILMLNYHCETCQSFICQAPYEDSMKHAAYALSNEAIPAALHHPAPV